MRIRMKETTALILGIILGLVMVLGGLYMILSPNVDCGGQTMSPGDSCVSMSSNGSGGVSDYSGQQRGQQVLGIAVLILGALMGTGCAFGLAPSKSRRRASVSSTSPRKSRSLSSEELMTRGEKNFQAPGNRDTLNAFFQTPKKKP